MITHLVALAAAHPAHVSNLRYATETWTPGGTALGVIILVFLIWAWIKVPSGPRVRVRRRAAAEQDRTGRARVPARR